MTKLTQQQLADYGLLGYRSKPNAKVVQPKHRQYKEGAEQGTIAHYLKKYHEGLPFITIEREKQRTFRAQNQFKLLNSVDSIPDTFIMRPVGLFSGLWIENKKTCTKLIRLSDGRFTSEHLANQYDTHCRLWDEGYPAYFAIGPQQAIEIVEAYLSGNALPQQIFIKGFELLKCREK